MSLLAGLSFGAPWVLAGLIVLPAIWWLLRVTPPAPRRVVFPPFRLLQGLASREETPARTPWWLLLLRIVCAALVVVALSDPIWGRVAAIGGTGPLVLFVDNDWAAAAAWRDRESQLSQILTSAARAGRAVAIVASADPVQNVSLLDAGQAERTAESLPLRSWLPDRVKAAKALAEAHFSARPEIVWLSDGLDNANAAATAKVLSQTGALTVFADSRAPVVLTDAHNEADGFVVQAARGTGGDVRDLIVDTLGDGGEELATAHLHFAAGETTASARLVLPLEVRNETRRLALAGVESAGAVHLLGSNAHRLSVGLVSASNLEFRQPLLSGLFYLKRALSPYADVHEGSVADALARNDAVIMLADVGAVDGADRDRLATFVGNGGVLVRFAGARMASHVDDLLPVKLRLGGRYLGGPLAWAAPQHLSPFPDASPFRGLAIPPEVTVSRQVLAEPSIDLAEHSWARLADGTPLVTAAPRDRGWIVLFHVTAGPAWSNLPLSGLYVDMLRRLLDLANGARPADLNTDASALYPPRESLDGYGHLQKPLSDATSLRGGDLGRAVASLRHPAGLYGNAGADVALNAAGPHLSLASIGDAGVSAAAYSGIGALALRAPLLLTALVLFLIDAIVSLLLRGFAPAFRRAPAAAIIGILFATMMLRSARADDSFNMKAALDTRLAYVVTGLSDVDQTSRSGLYGLGLRLKSRTSYEPEDPVGVDVERDELSFFPLLYWPMDPREHDLSPQAVARLTAYMKNGGTILFDTRDLTLGPVRGANSPGEQTLRRLTSRLDLPPLETIPSAHVLTKAFYLLQDFPGRWAGGKVWVEALPPPDPDAEPEPARGGDGVSPVIIGGNDWASAWAVDSSGRPLMDVSPGGEEQREMAVRFGINVVMYALTGNYKTDQVHAPALLERLGRQP